MHRLEETINPTEFERLMRLHFQYDWLNVEKTALVELWNYCNEDQKRLLEFLFTNFTYLKGADLNDAGIEIFQKISIDWGLTHENTKIVAICDDDKPDGSQSFLQSLKNKFSRPWKEDNFFNSIGKGMYEAKDGDNLVVLDDFIGTGNTVVRKITALKKYLENKKVKASIYVVAVGGMEFSKEQLDTLGIVYHAKHWLSRGITELSPEDRLEQYTNSMVELEALLQKKVGNSQLSKFNFGFGRSESLYAMEAYNVPNNVFPIFWWTKYKGGVERSTIFRRL